MSVSWRTAAQRIVTSVEAPDYDTRVASLFRAPMPLLMVGIPALAMADLFAIWWVDLLVGWVIFWFLWISFALLLALQYYGEIRRISRPDPRWDSGEALVVRVAAIAGDDTVAPLAQTQPAAPANWA